MAASVLALAACGDKSDETLVTSKAGDITKNELYEEMKDSVGEQALQLIVIEKVLNDKYDVTDKEVDAEVNKMKEQLGENFDDIWLNKVKLKMALKFIRHFNLLQEKALTDGVEVSEKEIETQIETYEYRIEGKTRSS